MKSWFYNANLMSSSSSLKYFQIMDLLFNTRHLSVINHYLLSVTLNALWQMPSTAEQNKLLHKPTPFAITGPTRPVCRLQLVLSHAWLHDFWAGYPALQPVSSPNIRTPAKPLSVASLQYTSSTFFVLRASNFSGWHEKSIYQVRYWSHLSLKDKSKKRNEKSCW